jgi:hypothetical protein
MIGLCVRESYMKCCMFKKIKKEKSCLYVHKEMRITCKIHDVCLYSTCGTTSENTASKSFKFYMVDMQP